MITKTQSQTSQLSIDSSICLSIDSSIESTQSLSSNLPKGKEELNLPAHPHEDTNAQDNQLQKQLPRFEQHKRSSIEFDKFQQSQPMVFVGFVGLGKNNKNKVIPISQSKMRMAQRFMKLDQSPYSKQPIRKQQQLNQSVSTESIEDSKTITDQQFPDFCMGFKSVGSGTMVKISEQSTNRAKIFLNDISEQKQTKTKINKNSSDNNRQSVEFTSFANLMKTQKSKIVPKQPMLKGNLQKKAWKIIKKEDSGKKILENSILRINQKYKNIKLKDLPYPPLEKQSSLAQSWARFKFQSFTHNNNCKVKWCYFCQKYPNKQIQISKQFIIQQVQRVLKPQPSTSKRLTQVLELIVFKLYRYQEIDSGIKNKQLNANNLLLQLYKKCLFFEKQKRGPLEISVSHIFASRGKNLGRHINLVIVSLAYTQQGDMCFLELSDGWTSVFAVVSVTNELFRLIGKRIIVGTKMQIVNWNLHPICNIAQYHPKKEVAQSEAYFIQINYNNSMPSQYFSKLGWPRHTFYRSVDRNKENGGNIAIVEGIILRMFTIRNNKNATTNYLQILLKEGHCILMKVTLADQISLVQLFRLYYCYHFLRVKKISNSLLQFLANSKYYEINDDERVKKVQQILQKRLLNKNLNFLIDDEWKENKKNYIDVVTKSLQFKVGEKKVCIDQKIEGTVLLQQYSLSDQPQGIMISKGDRGSCLRRIPKIYQKMDYHIL